MKRHSYATVFVLAALVLVGAACSDDADTTTTSSSVATTTTAAPPTTTTTPPTTTTVAPPPTTTTTPPTTTTAPPTTTTTAPPGPPPPLDLAAISGAVWGLYLFDGEMLDVPSAWVAFVNVGTYTTLAGVPSANHYSFGEFACDLGAAEALAVVPSNLTISMYFPTEADAMSALGALPPNPPAVGIAEVELGCAD